MGRTSGGFALSFPNRAGPPWLQSRGVCSCRDLAFLSTWLLGEGSRAPMFALLRPQWARTRSERSTEAWGPCSQQSSPHRSLTLSSAVLPVPFLALPPALPSLFAPVSVCPARSSPSAGTHKTLLQGKSSQVCVCLSALALRCPTFLVLRATRRLS